jgi:hypothetical protein
MLPHHRKTKIRDSLIWNWISCELLLRLLGQQFCSRGRGSDLTPSAVSLQMDRLDSDLCATLGFDTLCRAIEERKKRCPTHPSPIGEQSIHGTATI